VGPQLAPSTPVVTLPKGGGAIRGIGEKVSANPATGTCSTTVPIATSPGRSGFGPQLAVMYDSGAGNGPFGLGWSLQVPSVSRKTDRGLPIYDDDADSDVFILGGSEDLVPAPDPPAPTRLGGDGFLVRQYRPRIEGTFALIERWARADDRTDVFWRTISRDNVTTWFGRSPAERIVDPDDPARTFEWLISTTYDDRGNVAWYLYDAEDPTGVDTEAPWEANRRHPAQGPNCYLKRIRYGNRTPYMPTLHAEDLESALPTAWLFQLVFDYGDHDGDFPGPLPDRDRLCRTDAFSTHRPGFELRTYRRCERALMFHDMPEDPAVGSDCLVAVTTFTYFEPATAAEPERPAYSRLAAVGHWSYAKDDAGVLRRRPAPPVSFAYSEPLIGDAVVRVRARDLEGLPEGLADATGQWADLDGEGLSGILTEQANEWLYAPNAGGGSFGPARTLSRRPAAGSFAAGSRLMDLAGDGSLDVVSLDGPVRDFNERDNGGWTASTRLAALPELDWDSPDLRWLDLTGNGLADAAVVEERGLRWYRSLGEAGFAAAECRAWAAEEDDGPRLLTADLRQGIFAADMCGDGLPDLVRIRNDEVCYWPNQGYGRFGRKVTLSDRRLDHDEVFDPRRLRLADVDGSGHADVVYLGGSGAKVYVNRSGNDLSDPVTVPLPVATELHAVQVLDLLGTGTACLVWSSPLPADRDHPVAYVELMAAGKPHLLTRIDNNLGGTTEIEYTPSTTFYRRDRDAGIPWASRLPFPVHCVSRVTVRDAWRGTTFSSIRTYHHGYFAGREREFRGFGRVEQVDVEDFGTFASANAASPYVTQDHRLYQPPVKTVTWMHTGAPRLFDALADEWFPARFPLQGPFAEKALPAPDAGPDLSGDEWHEAARACKGFMLRQEVYELDVDDLVADPPRHTPVRLLTVATHGCQVERLQPRGPNAHGVFLVTETEALLYHHDLALPRLGAATPDPRIVHTLNLRHDELGAPQQELEVAYGRRGSGPPSGVTLDADAAAAATQAQTERHVTYSETRYTGDVGERGGGATPPVRHRRLRMPCEQRRYVITGLDPPTGGYYDRALLRRHALCEDDRYPPAPPTVAVTALEFHQRAQTPGPHRRPVRRAARLFFRDQDGIGAPSAPHPLGTHGPRGLLYASYELALTGPLLDAVLQGRDAAGQPDPLLDRAVVGGADGRAVLDGAGSGYVAGATLAAGRAGEYWIPSGVAGFTPGAAQRFYLPERFTDPFGQTTTIEYDPLGLYVRTSADPLGNMTTIEAFDHRVLAPRTVLDVNGNRLSVAFDVHGRVVATALQGKPVAGRWEGDSLDGLTFALLNPSAAAVGVFCTAAQPPAGQAHAWLTQASTRMLYDFGEDYDAAGRPVWARRMASACTITREQHAGALPAGAQSPLQLGLECSDGGGGVLLRKVQAEPDPAGPSTAMRWIVSGLTVVNNKGLAVMQYEPAFSQRFGPEVPQANGVATRLFYDATGRVVRTEHPDGTLTRVERTPWHVLTFDRNDTVLESDWYAARNQRDPAVRLPIGLDGLAAVPPQQRVGWLTAQHAGTPVVTILDTLGRDAVTIGHNRVPDSAGTHTFDGRQWRDDFTATVHRFGESGEVLSIRDPRGNRVMTSVTDGAVVGYDMVGNVLYRRSPDAGERWTLPDATGAPMLAWDVNDRGLDDGTTVVERRVTLVRRDALRRPVERWLRMAGGSPALVETMVSRNTAGLSASALTQARALNLLGRPVEQWDPSGVTRTERVDFKGAVQELSRRLVADISAAVTNWDVADRAALLEPETLRQVTEHDALGRMTRQYGWHRGTGGRVAVYEPRYNARGVLAGEDVVVGAVRTTSGYDMLSGRRTTVVTDVRYDAKGQQVSLSLGNGTTTTSTYEPETFRLAQSTTRAGTVALRDLAYTYDPVGNVIQIDDGAQRTVWFNNQQVSPSREFAYDALYRLTQASGRENAVATADVAEGPWPARAFPSPDATRRYTERYKYDGAGNLVAVRHSAVPLPGGPSGSWTLQHEMAANGNRLRRTWLGGGTWAATAPADRTEHRYDRHGNLRNVAATAPAADFRWNHRDRIRALDLQGGGLAFYGYDAGGERCRKTIQRVGGDVDDRIYLDGFERFRRTTAGTVVEEVESLHLFLGGERILLVDDVLRSTAGPRTLYRYQYGDHLGSVGLELDEAVRTISYEEFHPYGTSAYRAANSAIDAPPKRYRYTGVERDEESGLCSHGARYSHPALRRWLSPDPSGIVDGLNLFAYCRDSPVVYHDPGGHATPPVPSPPPADVVKFIKDTGGFMAADAPKGGPPRFNWRHAGPFGVAGHSAEESFLQELKAMPPNGQIPEIETYFKEVAIEHGTNTVGKVGGSPIRGAHNIDTVKTTAGSAPVTLGDVVQPGQFEVVTDSKFGRGQISQAHSQFGQQALTVDGRSTPQPGPSMGAAAETEISFSQLHQEMTAPAPPPAPAPAAPAPAPPQPAEVTPTKVAAQPVTTNAAIEPVKVNTVENAGVKAVVEPPAGRGPIDTEVRAKVTESGRGSGGFGPGFFLGLALMAWGHFFPEDQKKLGDHLVDETGPAIGRGHAAVFGRRDATEDFIQKTMSSRSEPSENIQNLMARHGWRFGGMEDGAAKWTRQEPVRSVRLIVR
jgi:RHS repeat-associated protein